MNKRCHFYNGCLKTQKNFDIKINSSVFFGHPPNSLKISYVHFRGLEDVNGEFLFVFFDFKLLNVMVFSGM